MRHYGGHRIIWEMVNGPIPKGMQIDHIDGNRRNNAITNLRLATPMQNTQNRKVSKISKSQLKGVYKYKNRWVATINLNRKRYYLGMHKTKEGAHAAYCAKSIELHKDFSNAKPK